MRKPFPREEKKPHDCTLPKGEKWATPQIDRDCMKVGGHKKGDRVVCDEPGCGRHFGRVCLMCGCVV